MPYVDLNNIKLDAGNTGQFVDLSNIQLDDGQETKSNKQANPLQKAQASVQGRMVHGMLDPIFGIAQMVPRGAGALAGLVGANDAEKFYKQSASDIDQLVQQRNQEYEAAKSATGFNGADLARFAGNVFTPANIATAAATKALPVATSYLGKLGQNALLGGASAAMQPVESGNNFSQDKLTQIGVGAAVPAALQTGGAVLGNIISPTLQKGADKLIKEGVRLTPGQMLGGATQWLEDTASSVPFLGSTIRNARHRGFDDFNKAIANRALKPVGESIPDSVPVGRDMVEYVGNKLSEKYDEILPKMRGVADKKLFKDVATVGKEASQELSDKELGLFKNKVAQLFNKKNGSVISGEDSKVISSTLSKESNDFLSSQDPLQRKLGEYYGKLNDSFKEMLYRNNPKELTKQLKDVDTGYANFIRFAKAGTGIKSGEGVTPSQLSNAVKSTDKSVRKMRYAKGGALMQDLSDAAQAVLPSTVPNSGTAERAALIGLLAGGPAYMPALTPAAVSTGALSGLYTRPGVAAMEALIAKRPELAKPVSRVIKQATPPIDFLRTISRGGSNVPVK